MTQFSFVPPGPITAATLPYNPLMEADRLNQIQTTLQDLAARTAEIRRYL